MDRARDAGGKSSCHKNNASFDLLNFCQNYFSYNSRNTLGNTGLRFYTTAALRPEAGSFRTTRRNNINTNVTSTLNRLGVCSRSLQIISCIYINIYCMYTKYTWNSYNRFS